MRNRAFIFTMDAVLALVPIAIITATIAQTGAGNIIATQTQSMEFAHTAEDSITVLEKLGTLDEIAAMYVDYTALQSQGEAWETARDAMINEINTSVRPLIPEHNGFAFEFWGYYVNGTEYVDNVYSTDNYQYGESRPYSNQSTVSAAAVKMASGYAREQPITGYVSRAWIDELEKLKINMIYFADPVHPQARIGGGTTPNDWIQISHNITVPVDNKGNITNVTWYLAPIGVSPVAEVRAYLNDNNVYNGTVSGFVVLTNSTLYQYIQPGDNNFTMITRWNAVTSGSGDKASRILVSYYNKTAEEYIPKIYPLETVIVPNSPTIPARIADYEKPIFVPNADIQSLSVTLRAYASTAALGFQYKDQTITISFKTFNGWDTQTWTDGEISSALAANNISYADLKDKYFKFLLNINGFPVSGFPSEAQIDGSSSYVYVDATRSVSTYGYFLIHDIPAVYSYSNQVWWSPVFYSNVSYRYFIGQGTTPWYTRFHILWTAQVGSTCDQSLKANDVIISQSPPFIPNLDFVGYTSTSYLGSIQSGTNGFNISLGWCYGASPFGTLGEFSYLIPSSVGFGDAFDNLGDGYDITVYYDADQNNVSDGSQVISVGGGGPVKTFAGLNPTIDAQDDALLRLMDTLNFIDDANDGGYGTSSATYDGNSANPIDVVLSPDITVDSEGISGVPFMWGAVKMRLRVWG